MSTTPYNNLRVNDLTTPVPVPQPYVNSNVEAGYFYPPVAPPTYPIINWYSMNTTILTKNGIATGNPAGGLEILNAGIYRIHLSFFPVNESSNASAIKFNFGTKVQSNTPTNIAIGAFGGSNSYGMYTFDNNYNKTYPGIISWLANGYNNGNPTAANFTISSANELNFTYNVDATGGTGGGQIFAGICTTQITFILNQSTMIYLNVSANQSGVVMGDCYFTLELISDTPPQLKNWTNQNNSPAQVWTSIASDSTGQYLAAVAFPGAFGGIYTSNNYGSTWSNANNAPISGTYWNGIASSSDGTKLVAVYGNPNGTGAIWRSSNYGSGSSWAPLGGGLPSAKWLSITSSDDGTHLAAVVFGGGIWTSTNSGTNWSNNAPNADWWSIASSSDGTKIVAVINDGVIGIVNGIWRSTNSGSTWSQTSAPTEYWRSIASSDDGTHLAAVVSGYGGIWTSSDSGSTWTQTSAPSGNVTWTSIASSSTGQYLAAVVSGAGIYTSTDYGANWSNANNAPSEAWSSIAMSSGGAYSAAVNGITKIYTSIASY